MKKVITVLFVLAFVVNVSAHRFLPIYMNYDNLSIKGDAVLVPEGRGTIKLVQTGDKFSDVVFTDASGKITRLVPVNSSAENLPKLNCKYPVPGACFSSPDKNIGMCICRPTNIADGSAPYTVALLLPAVQSAREAASRLKASN